MKPVLIFTLIFSSLNSFSQEIQESASVKTTSTSKTCDLTEKKFSELRASVPCLSQDSIWACGLVGAGVLAGKGATTLLKKKFLSNLDANKDRIVRDLSDELFEAKKSDGYFPSRRGFEDYISNLEKAREDLLNDRIKIEEKIKNFDKEIRPDLDRSPSGRINDVGVRESRRKEVVNRLARLDKQIEDMRVNIEKSKDALRSKLVGPWYKPDIRNLTFIDAKGNKVNDLVDINNDDQRLVQSLKKQLLTKEKEIAQKIYDKFYQAVKSGQNIHDPKFMRSITNKIAPLLTNLDDIVASKIVKQLVAKTAMSFNLIATNTYKGLNNIGSAIASQVRKASSSALGRAASRTAVRGLAVLGFVGGLAFYTESKATACSSLDDYYTNSSGDNCEPNLGVSEGVLEFIKLPYEEAVEKTKDSPKLCAFYKELHKITHDYKVYRPTCEGNIVRTKYKVGEQIFDQAIFLNPGSDSIRTVLITGKNGSYLKQSYSDEGTNYSSEGSLSEATILNASKKEAATLVAVCKEPNEAERAKLLDKYNSYDDKTKTDSSRAIR